MSKICPTCGNQMDDSTMFCVNCGTPVPTPAPAPAPVKEKKAKKVDVAGLTNGLKSNPKKLAVLGAVAAVVVIVLIVILVSLLSNPWKSGLNNYYDLLEGKQAAVTKNIPNDAYDWIDDKYGLEKKDITADKKDYAEDISENIKDNYGDNVKYTYKVVKSKKFTKKMLEDLADGIENTYDIDAKKVKAAYVVEIEYDISGKDAFTWGENTVVMVKIGSGWYVVGDYGGEGKEAYASLSGLSRITNTETFQKEADK